LIQQLLRGLDGFSEPAEQKHLSEIACRIVNLINSTSENQQPELVELVFKVMYATLMEQGHFTTFVNLAKDILSFSALGKTSQSTQNLIWHHQLLSVGSAQLQNKKPMQVVPLCKEIETVSRKGFTRRDLAAVSLLKARTQLALKNYSTAQQALNID